MATTKRNKTKYPGVFFREEKRIGASGSEKVYYVVFKKNGKVIEEKVGRQFVDDMTPAKASRIRSELIEGKRKTRKIAKEEALAASLRKNIHGIWEEYAKGRPKSKNTDIDLCRYKLHLENIFGHKFPEEITTNDVRVFKDNLLQSGKSPQTVLNTLAFLLGILLFGEKNGFCTLTYRSPLVFEMPKVDNIKTENLTETQLKALMEALDAETDQVMASCFRLALVTGMRKGALLALEWTDLDFEQGIITLQGRSAKKGKTAYIPMSEAAKIILEKLPHTSRYVFPNAKGEKRSDFRSMPNRIKQKAQLPTNFRPFHGLRHTYASHLASSGKVDLYTLQKLLTHSSPQMTQRYAHLADEAMKRAARVADDILTSNMEKKDDE